MKLHTECFSTFFVFLCHRICHTTRGPYFGEENGIDYYFVFEEDFQNMIHMVRGLHSKLSLYIADPRISVVL